MNANISIIVPVYNAEKTLHRCVNSIINQSYKCWELLLVNDGSTDNSATICDEYALLDKRIKVFHKKNEGVSCARNVGVDNATGEWITFVDSDDWLDSEALFYYKQEEDVDLVLSAIFSHEKGKCNKIILEKMKCHQLNTIGRVLSLLNNYVGLTTPWAKLLKKSILLNHNLRFDEKIVSGEDTLFIYKYLYYINSISCVNKACYHWNNSNKGLSSNKLSIEEIDYVISNIIKSLKDVRDRYNVDIRIRYYNTILYFITKYDFKGKCLADLYNTFLLLSAREYFNELINADERFVSKGVRRKLIDFSFKRGWYKLTAIFVFLTKRFYF